jgi:hypothetical protein
MRSRVRFPVLPWGFFLEGEGSHGDHGLGSLVELRFMALLVLHIQISPSTSSGVPTSEVGYTSASTGDHEVHKGYVVVFWGGGPISEVVSVYVASGICFFYDIGINQGHVNIKNQWSFLFEDEACRKHVYRQFSDCCHQCSAPTEKGNAVVGSVVTSFTIRTVFCCSDSEMGHSCGR